MSLRQLGFRPQVRTLTKGAGLALGALLIMTGSAFAQSAPPGGDVIVGPGGSGTNTGTTTGTTPLSDVRFACKTNLGQPTVMYFPDNQPNTGFAWAVPSAMGGGWSSDLRCAEIARRLESYRPDGLLEMKTGVENGLNTICVTTDRVPTCRIVLTVPKGQNPTQTRDRVFQNLTVAESGQQTQGVYTYGDSGSSNVLGQLGQVLGLGGRKPAVSNKDINLKPFLSQKDGGTGARLVGGIRVNQPAAAPTKKPRLFGR